MPSFPPVRRALPGAVSVLSAAVVHGAACPAGVLGVHGPALYLDVAGRVLPVVTTDAVPLPTAVRLAVAGGGVDWGVGAGDVVTVGDGRVALPAFDVVASRTWRPSRVRRVPASAPPARTPWHLLPDQSAAANAASSAGHDDESRWLADGIRSVFAEPGPGVAHLVGRGRGLTPSGDDALAGALLVAHAFGSAAPLATAVRARLHATTAVSAALLDAAGDGFAVRDVVTLVDAVLAGDAPTVAAVLPAVLALGHSSGHDLVTGVAAALEALRGTRHPNGTARSAA